MKQDAVQRLLYDAERDHWWFQARRTIVDYLFWEKILDKRLKALCIGCGTGQQLLHIQRYCNVIGLDIDSTAVAFCRQQNLQAIEADIVTNKLPNESFDIVVATDVIEHIEDDIQAVEAIYKLLKPGGKLLLTVPACPFLWSKHDEASDHPHYRRYTSATLNMLIEKKFKIHLLSYYNFFLFPLVFIVRKLNLDFENQLAQPSYIVNQFFKSVLSFERFILSFISFPIGVSLLVIAEKK